MTTALDDPAIAAQVRAAAVIRLYGNASKEGSPEYNGQLACRRAARVAADLAADPLVTAPTSTFTHGATTAFSGGTDDAGTGVPNEGLRALNRNVEVVCEAKLTSQPPQTQDTTPNVLGPTDPFDPTRRLPPGSYDLSINVDDTSDTGDLSVGHSWLEIQRPDGTTDSFGFWPDSPWAMTGVLDGDGKVHRPDESHRPTEKWTKRVTVKEYRLALQYAKDHEYDNYNLLNRNCVTFARNAYLRATGENAPSGSLISVTPGGLGADIVDANAARGLDPMGRPDPAGRVRRPMPWGRPEF